MILVENIKSRIYVFGREGKIPYIKQYDFKPYFYIPDKNGDYVSLTGKRLRKIVANTPDDVKVLRRNFPEHYEADVLFVNRFIIDNFYKSEILREEIRKFYFDIEVDDSVGYDAVFSYRQPIISITIYDNFTKKYYTIHTRNLDNSKTENHIIIGLSSEEALLKFFVKLLNRLDPDILIGWNVWFDISYILERMIKYNLNINNLSRINRTIYIPENKVAKIYGRIVFDLMEGYRHISLNQLPSYSLEFVSQYEIGEGKEKFHGTVNNLSVDKLISYNKRDVELLKLLDEGLHIIDLFDTVRRIAKVNFNDVFSAKRVIDSFCLSYAKKLGIVLPSQLENAEKPVFEGAYVKQPPSGLHDWVIGLDFKSLYPSIIRQFNMSYETYLTSPEEGCINIDNKYYFKPNPVGFIPRIVDYFINERKKFKILMKKSKSEMEYKSYYLSQWALKILANATYGVITTPFFRLFNPKIGEAITYMGRRFIKFADSKWKEKGYEVVIIDTDSTYVKVKAESLEDAVKQGEELYNFINSLWDGFLDQFNAAPNKYMEMEFEKVYNPLLTIGVKKRYAGLIVWKDGKVSDKPEMDVKGLQIIRSDFPIKAQKFLRDVVYSILKGDTRKDITDMIKKFKKEFKQAPVEEIGFPTSLKPEYIYKNKPIQLRAMLNSQKYLNIPYKEGKIRYYFVKKTPKDIPFDNVWVFEDKIPEGFELDWDRFFERIIKNPLEPIFKALNWKLHTTLSEYI